MEMKSADRRNGFFVSKLSSLISWAAENALTGMPLDLGCCSASASMNESAVDVEYNPRHADVLVVSGALSRKGAQVVRNIYDQMGEPKYVVAFGTCACNGGLFADSYAVVSKISDILPVDVFVPGCPPDAADFADALKTLCGQIAGRKKG